MLNRLIGEDISLNIDVDPGLWTVNGDVATIEQVIMNLVVNARDAMPDGRGPNLIDPLLELKPEIGVLFTSGYSDEKSDWSAIKELGCPYLQKPYSLSDLFKVIRETLENVKQKPEWV